MQPKRAYDGDGLGPVRDYRDAMRVVSQQLREFADAARQRKVARQHADAIQAGMDGAQAEGTGGGVQVAQLALPAALPPPPVAAMPSAAPPGITQAALDRAGRRLGYVADEIARGELPSAGAHPLLGKPYPPEVDNPPPGGFADPIRPPLAPLPGFTESRPDQANPGFGADPDAGNPTVLATPAAPQDGPEMEGFEPSSIGPVVFDNRTIEQFREKLDRQFGNLKSVDFDAARQEMAGKVVAEKAGGRPYDHVQKVANAMTGVTNIIGELTRRLSHPDLTDADRQAVTALLSEASRKIEEARRMVPGIGQRLGDYK